MPQVNIAPNVFQQEHSGNGDPLNGGKIYTYEAGTSTEKTTYSDATGNTPNDNPIILDSEGRYNMFLPSGAFKFVLKDSDDTLIDQKDNISSNSVVVEVDTVDDMKALVAGSQSLIRTLGYSAANDGGGWWYYWNSSSSTADDGGMVIQPDSLPATGRWIGLMPANRLLNLRIYGAACDGSTDDISELQACDTWCAANNCIILVDSNTYFSTDPSLSSKVKLLPSAQLRWGNINPTLDVIIDGNDKTQHFNNNATYVPTLNVNEIYPEWFGETEASHAITTAAIAALSGQKHKFITQYRFKDELDADAGADIEGNVDIAGTLDSHGVTHLYDDVQIDGDVTMDAKHISFDGSTTEGLYFPNASNIAIIESTITADYDSRAVLVLRDNNSLAQGIGAGVEFQGVYNVGGDTTEFSSIKGYKTNATDGNTSGQMHFQTKLNGGNPTTHLILDESGNFNIINGILDADMGADIEGNVDIAGTLDSHGAVHLYDAVEIDGLLDADAGADIEGNVDIAGTLDSHGAVHLYDAVEIDGLLNADAGADIEGNVDIAGILDVHTGLDMNDSAITNISSIEFDATAGYIIQLEDDADTGIYYDPATNQISFRLDAAEKINMSLSSGDLVIQGILVVPTHTPASASASGTTGTITWDSDYIYICVATNTWKRVAISTW